MFVISATELETLLVEVNRNGADQFTDVRTGRETLLVRKWDKRVSARMLL